MFARLTPLALFIALVLLGAGCTHTTENPEPEAWPVEKRAQAHVKLGMNYLQRNNLEVAREAFEKAIEVNPKSSEAYHGLGLVEAKALNLNAAREHFATAVRLDGNNISAVNDYAVLLCQEGQGDAGAAVLEKHVKDPSLGGIASYLAFGRCYDATGERGKAREAYNVVLKMDPELPQALLSMAYINFEEENYLSSSAFLQRYFYTNRISSDALLLAAQVEDILDNPEERDFYTQLLWSRYPRSEQARQAREQFR